VEPALAGVPLATWAQDGSRRVLVAVDATRGLHPGQALADARAIRPDLVLRPADPDGDAAELGRLALWALRFTPLAGTDPSDGLLLDVTGCAHLFAGEAALLHEATEGLARLGFDATAALADAPDAAAALARCGRHGAIVPPGEEAAAAVAPLPLAAALRLAPGTAAALHRLGLRRVGDLLRLPRGPLARRFGQGLLDALDAATGARPRPIEPVRPPPALAVARDFAEPIATRAAIDAAADGLLGLLCGALRDAGLGARRVALRAFRVDGAVQEVAVGTGAPTREPAHLRRLLAERLGRLEPDLGFERLALEAREAEPLTASQIAGLPIAAGDPATHGDEATAAALAGLLDRLAQRLAVWRLAPRAGHWPERAVARVGPFAHVAAPPGWPGPAARLSPRPVRLLRRPVPLDAVALLPDAPPALLRFGGEAHRVARADGPERIEPEWWRDDPAGPCRDYYRVELASGARLWVCRVGLVTPPERPAARWVLHGRFA
jgi:protein ImuB